MINNTGNNLINTQVGGQATPQAAVTKKSQNMYYNIFSKKMEEIEIPDIDLEFNAILNSDTSTFMKTA